MAGARKPTRTTSKKPAKKPAAKQPAAKQPAAKQPAKPAAKHTAKPAATPARPARKAATSGTVRATWQPSGRSWGPGSQLARARNLEMQGDLEGARDSYRLAIRDEDGGTGCELLLLDVLDRLEDAEAVFELVGALEARGVESVVIGTARSRALTRSNNWPEALVAARQAIAIDPDHAKAWIALAEASRAGGDPAAAVAAGREITRLAPRWVWGWYDLANDLKELGRYPEAIAAAEQVVAIDPELGDGWFNLACFRARAGLEGPALDALEAAVRCRAENAAIALADDDFTAIRTHPRFLALCGYVA